MPEPRCNQTGAFVKSVQVVSPTEINIVAKEDDSVDLFNLLCRYYGLVTTENEDALECSIYPSDQSDTVVIKGGIKRVLDEILFSPSVHFFVITKEMRDACLQSIEELEKQQEQEARKKQQKQNPGLSCSSRVTGKPASLSVSTEQQPIVPSKKPISVP
jgi:hypothetical protein